MSSFTVIDDTIYWEGRAFAVLSVSPVSDGGWVIDARDAIEGIDYVTEEEVTEFRTAFRGEINDTLNECLTHAVEKLWLPEPFHDILAELIGPALRKGLDEEIARTLRLEFKAEE
jgi:hypothetical protein